MNKLIVSLAVLASAMGFALSASANVMTFDSLAHADADAVDAGLTYAEDGFQVATTGLGFGSWGTQSDFYAGSTGLFNNNDSGVTVLSKVGGGAFSLSSIMLADEFFYAGYTPSVSVTFDGLTAAGTHVFQSFTLASVDGVLNTQTFTFGSEFSNLVAVSWANDADFHQFDNINVSPVPAPAAIFLMGSSLLGLFGYRGKRA